jgi:hypothetical protein
VSHPIPEPLKHGPFRSATALALGVTPDDLRGPRWRRLCRDVYVSPDLAVTPMIRARAAALVAPAGAVITGATAAWLHGCDVRRSPDEPVEVTAPRGVTLTDRGGLLRPLQAAFGIRDVVEVGGLAVSSPMRTAFDLARRPDLTEGVVAVDAMTRAGLVVPGDLLRYAAAHRGWRGVRRVPRVVEFSDAGAESPMESRLRMLVVARAGLPRPTTQVVVAASDGRLVARLDMGYEELRLGLEYDGHGHALRAVRTRDLRRHNDLVAMGWRCLVFGWEDVMRHPVVAAARIRSAYRALAA